MKGPATLFTDHPSSVGETYGEHFRTAAGFGLAMVGAGLACLVHALMPMLFVRTGSSTIEVLHQRMLVNRKGRSSSEIRD